MSSQSSTDPYRAPSLLPGSVAPAHPRRRPGWFVTVCVIAIALGGTGFLHSLYGLAELTVGDPLDAVMSMQSSQEDEAELERIEEQIDQEIADIEDRYYPALLPLALARTALTIGLVVGGVGCLGGKRAARTLLVVTMAAALLFEVCDSVVQGFLLSEFAGPLRQFGQAIDDQSAAPNGPPNLAEMIMVIVFWGITCFFYVCQVAKGMFYLGGLLYLRRSALDPLFEPPPEMAQAVGP